MFPFYGFEPNRPSFPSATEDGFYPYPYPPYKNPIQHPKESNPYNTSKNLGFDSFSDRMKSSGAREDHSYSHHFYPPGYYGFRPPYAPYNPSSHMYYHPPYDPYYQPFHPYTPPHNMVDHEFNNRPSNRNHCCGCPNHICHRRESDIAGIEESKPEKQQEDCAPPVIWVNPRQMMEREGGKASETKQDGWIPLDMDALRKLMQGERRNGNSGEFEKGSEMQHLVPNGWIPLDANTLKKFLQGDKLSSKDIGEVQATPSISEEQPSKVKIVPLKQLQENEHQLRDSALCNPSLLVGEMQSSKKEIPVKFVEDTNHGRKDGELLHENPVEEVEKRNLEISRKQQATEKNAKKDIPVKFFEATNQGRKDGELLHEKRVEGNEKRRPEFSVKSEATEKNAEARRISLNKPLKLPPVCLRIDPLPTKKKKKSSNGSSQSSSHSNVKGKESESIQPQKGEIPVTKDKKEKEERKKEVNVIEVEDKSSINISGGIFQVPVIKVPKGAGHVSVSSNDSEQSHIMKNTEIGCNSSAEDEHLPKLRRELSELVAATIIQSAYRGFETRRWRPLEKLRTLAQVRERVGEIKKEVVALEVSKQLDLKQKMVLGETIMNLLLQIDTVQGLPLSSRELRKSVARDLVCLQEKLDSLSKQMGEENDSKKAELEAKEQRDEETLRIDKSQESEVVKPLDADESQVLNLEDPREQVFKSQDEVADSVKEDDLFPEIKTQQPDKDESSSHTQDFDEGAEKNSDSIQLMEMKVDDVNKPVVDEGILEEEGAFRKEKSNLCKSEPANCINGEGKEGIIEDAESLLDQESNILESKYTIAAAEDEGDMEEAVESPIHVDDDEGMLEKLVEEEKANCVKDVAANVDFNRKGINSEDKTEDQVGDGNVSVEPAAPSADPEEEEEEEEEKADNKKLFEENNKLHVLLEKLLESGKQQLGAINSLNSRVRELEKKVAQKRRPAKAKRLKKKLAKSFPL